MVAPSPRSAPSAARRFPIALAAFVALLAARPGAFVTLDTSASAPPRADSGEAAKAAPPPAAGARPDSATPAAAAPRGPAAPEAPASSPAPAASGPPLRQGLPHFRNVLFLSADNMLVYAYLGALKAMEEFKVGPDLVVSEGKAVLAGAAWALDYPMVRIEEKLVAKPLSDYLKPIRPNGSLASRFAPFGPDPIQVEVPLSLQSLQSPELRWSEAPSREGDEYLHLSWMVAKLTHDAPGGPVEDLRGTAKPFAVQVTDLVEERGKVLMDGNLQTILKAGLLPSEAVYHRKRLWPQASGVLASGRALMPAPLPFTFDRLIVVQPGRHLRPPPLEESKEPWRDSLEQRFQGRPVRPSSGNAAGASENGDASRRAGNLLRIELNPDAGFDPSSRDPKAWIDLGYASALRSMDVLLSTLGRIPASNPPREKPAEPDPGRKAHVGLQAAPSQLPPPLGLDRLTVNPLASGGRQLLQDLVRQSVQESGDSTGDAPISDLVRSGFYSDLDVEWVSGMDGEIPSLVFDAREKSRLMFLAAANAANAGEDLPDRGPEIYSGLIWSEPFYVPFRAEGAFLLGGHRPGISGRLLVEPIRPMHLELGFSRKKWQIRYPEPPGHTLNLDPLAFRMDRTLSDLFLNLLPLPGLRLSTVIQKHEMDDLRPLTAEEIMQGAPSQLRNFESTDFQQTGFLGLGRPGASGLFRQSLWVRFRNMNRLILFGPVKYSSSSLETRLRLSFGDFRLWNQYYWSDQDISEPGLFEYFEAGEIKAYSFQDEFFFGALRARHFNNMQAEYAPSIGRAGLRLLAGGFRTYGRNLDPRLGPDFTGIYWEAQVSYATPVGPLRAGLAGLEDDTPVYFLRIGADLDLDRGGPED